MSYHQKKVCMLVRNNFLHDTRVLKEAQSLGAWGHTVQIIAINKLCKLKTEETIDRNVKLLRVNTRSNKGHRTEQVNVDIELQVVNKLSLKEKLVYLSKYAMNRIFNKLKIRKLLNYFIIEKNIIRNAVATKADIYHAHDLNMLMEAFICAKLNKAKLVYDSHELFVERNTARGTVFQKKTLKIMERFLIRRCDAVITVTESIAEYLAKIYNIKTPSVIRNSQPYEIVDKTNKFKEILNLPEDSKIAVYVGRITFNRGLENLILSARHLSPKSLIVLMGNGSEPYIEQLESLIKDNSLQEKVFILPPVLSSEVSNYVASADIGVIPTPNVCLSYYFGASNKLFHYMMAGLPILVSDHPEKRRIVIDNEIGDVFDPDNPENIAKQINKILDDQNLNKMYSKNSFKSALTYNWENEERKLVELYRGMLG